MALDRPHDGRNLTLTQLVSAMRSVYSISCPLGLLLAGGGLAKCGHWGGVRRVLDLHELARHGVIEHDGSLVHADVAAPSDVYAPTEVDAEALRQLLEGEKKGEGRGELTLEDLCKRQVARQDAARPLSGGMTVVARGELGLVCRVFGVPVGKKGPRDVSLEKEKGPSLDSVRDMGGAGGRVVPKVFLEPWFGEERLPDGWEGLVEGTGLFDLIGLAREIKALKDQIRRSGKETAGSKGATG